MAEGPSSGGERLDSWKAIAEYLSRDVATVRRWERTLGLPVRRVAGSGRSVFAYRSEIDAWLRTDRASAAAPAPAATPRSVRPRARRLLAVGAGVLIAGAGLAGAFRSWLPGDPEIVRLEVTAEHVAAFDAAGAEQWRHEFPADLLTGVSDVTSPYLVVPPPDPAAFVVVSHTVRRADQQGGEGALLEFSPGGRLRRSFSFDDEIRIGGRTYGPPWAVTTLAVDGAADSRRVAVAGHHYTWDPSPVTILDADWRRLGTFVHAGWVEALAWIARDRLLIGGYSESREGGMVALLDPARLDGQGPETPGTRHYCESCGAGQPLRMAVMPRTEVNRAAGWRFNRVILERPNGRVLARTIELGLDGGAADVIYEFSPALDLVAAAFSERYWDAHRLLEAQGKLDHPKALCADRNGPRTILTWDPAAGWRRIPLR
ncbi:MAG TPA: hypothetical protein VM364_06320 [Vicinamibacterales bacterium]|nr:hypothetical protein [Vicinamibacterales bacterium]